MSFNFPEATSARTILASVLMLLAGCAIDSQQAMDAGREPRGDTALEKAMIVGSAETPDPVLARVRELEARGRVEDVVVRESFPVQIELRAPRAVIDELEAIPRKGGLR